MENTVYVGKAEQAHQEESIWNSNTFKKYKLSGIVIAIGAWFAPVAVLGGFLAGLGTQMGMERLRDSAPSVYNWILDNPGKVELLSMIAYAGAFGLTLGGVLISLVANFTMSAVLDYYAEKEGRIANVERLSISGLIKSLILKIKNLFKTVKSSTQEGLAVQPTVA